VGSAIVALDRNNRRLFYNDFWTIHNPWSYTNIVTNSDLVYGNELELGKAIKESGVDRSKLFVTTKIADGTLPDVEAGFKESLKKLQLDYVDLYVPSTAFLRNAPNKPKIPHSFALLG